MSKSCSKCKEHKDLKEFNKDSSRNDGYKYICKLCDRKQMAKHRENNKEKLNLRCRNRYWENVDKERERGRDYHKRNPEKANNRANKRRAAKRNATPVLSAEEHKDLETIYSVSRFLSDYEGVKYNVDHIKPLFLGGLHHPDNLQILTELENKRKGIKYGEEQ